MTSPVVEPPPPTTTERPQPRSTGDAAALVFRRRVQIIDRIARALISASGMAIIAAVLGIGLFLFLEIVPLLVGARVQPGPVIPVLPAGESPRFILVDEHQERAAVIGETPVIRVVPLTTSAAAVEELPLAELQGARVSAAAVELERTTAALGTQNGRVWVGRITLRTVFDGSVRSIQASVEPELVVDVAPGQAITSLGYREASSQSVLASIVDGERVSITRITTRRPLPAPGAEGQAGLVGPVQREQEQFTLPMEPSVGRPAAILVNETATQVLVGTSRGAIIRWQLADEAGLPRQLETIAAVPAGGVSVMVYLLGTRSISVGGSDGSVATWSLVRSDTVSDGWTLTRIHAFARHPDRIAVIAPSPRDKGFITASADGTARLHYMTSEQTLAEFALGGPPVAAVLAPKANGASFLTTDGRLHHWQIRNPHPEFSWRVLFRPVWYEGYPAPEHVWQSTGGTDDFESKFGLIPLIFGTLKGTCYAMLFAVPLALFGALYCSQFLDKHLRNPVKSTVELMAALPSVVMGFVAGVVLAPFVQGHLVSVLSLPVLLPLVVLGGMALGVRCPWTPVRTFARRHEFWVLGAWIIAGIALAGWLGPWIERALFGGDFEQWLSQTAGIRYDQRNSLVVGWAMGFAVIPIIFTICEDAFSAVPSHLVGASLACGASAWQTAWRVVLPAAGSGVFSAVMVGFGRAVGETMIVLMATGNTPVLDWSMFNGFRALSANIAVEIPEAPHGGTLYRVLFIAALLLFAITFIVNTVAEVIRLRLRRQLQGL